MVSMVKKLLYCLFFADYLLIPLLCCILAGEESDVCINSRCGHGTRFLPPGGSFCTARHDVAIESSSLYTMHLKLIQLMLHHSEVLFII